MINERRRWLYSKTVEPRIYEVGEDLQGKLYDSPAFDDPRTVMVNEDASEENSKPVKYPSQMNKDELIEHGNLLGIEMDGSMSRREMLAAVNQKVAEAKDENDIDEQD